MERRIIELHSPKSSIILDVDEIAAAYTIHDEGTDEFGISIVLKGRHAGLKIYFTTKDKADKGLEKIAERMIK